ncbi:MAG TPA: nucleoside hydrolase [Hypericibacter adhaerens]|jgi:purine nucleosidase|uniref:nucleoside hydrolase n=1 Tax=Hypericibacter adhaerens TaxID=2602016 RepID=UPI002B6163C3|nr:nucleoside hydrolase [Hypericibacter adhaerens]HWA43687.1 nucleoside hydrolase [Hypericibacter adhaerens]
MPQPLIIDTDPGKDDAVAILLALSAPEIFDIRMMSAAAGNVGLHHTSANIRRLCDVAGRPDIAVHAGCPRPILRALQTVPDIHGEDGLAGADLPPPVMPMAERHAVPALIDAISASDRPVSVACIAPVTNMALACVMAPEIAENTAEIVIMGGTFGRGNITPYASFNIYNDPHAASILFGGEAPVTMMGLDVTRRTMPTPEWCARLAATGRPAARVVAGLWRDPTAFMNDACVVAYLMRPDLFKTEWRHVEIEINDETEMGRTRLIGTGEANVKVATDIDVPGFFELLFRQLGR